jgi:alpha-amylase/alpha-mannosidase (GH57 family)
MAMLSNLDYLTIAKLCDEYGYKNLMFAISAILANKLENIGVSKDYEIYPSPLSNMKDSKVTNETKEVIQKYLDEYRNYINPKNEPTCKDCKYCGDSCTYRNPTGLWCGEYYPKDLPD